MSTYYDYYSGYSKYAYLALVNSLPQSLSPATCVTTNGYFSCTGYTYSQCTMSSCYLASALTTTVTGCTDIYISISVSAYSTYTASHYYYGKTTNTYTKTSVVTYAIIYDYSTTTFIATTNSGGTSSAHTITSIQTVTTQSLSYMTSKILYPITSDLYW